MAKQHHQHSEGAGRGGEAEQGLEEQHGPFPNRVVADALTHLKADDMPAERQSHSSRQARDNA
jgi:hypothetical protein